VNDVFILFFFKFIFGFYLHTFISLATVDWGPAASTVNSIIQYLKNLIVFV